MPRQQAFSNQRNFVRGLITQNTALNFPENACTETFDCIFDETGRVSRRLGFDLEDGFVVNEVSLPLSAGFSEVFTEFLWEAVGGNGAKQFLVQQQGDEIHFFDVSTTSSPSSTWKSTFTNVLLSDFLPPGSTNDPALAPCAYASGNGYLFIVNRYTDPIYVSYDPDTDAITPTRITLQFRDFEGADDGLDVTERPTESVSSLQTNNPEHYYNIINQSWWTGDALSQWDAARTDMPSNADVVAYYRSSLTDAFDNAIVTSKAGLNSPAPKGHFRLYLGNPSRSIALFDEGFTGVILSAEDFTIGQGEGSILTDFDVQTANAFDSNTSQTGADCAQKSGTTVSGYIGKTFTSGRTIYQMRIHGSTDVGYNFSFGAAGMVLDLYGKQGAAPSSGTDGTLLGSTGAFNENADESPVRTITVTGTLVSTPWDHIWALVRGSTGTPASFRVAEVFFDEIFAVDTFERPSAVAFFAGRVWYAGIEAQDYNSRIFFTQIIERPEQFGQCFQTNDPTSEDLSEFLASDGGVVNIPEIASIKKLFNYQSALLVFASNGTWTISGSSQAGFVATDYQVKRISAVGTQSPLSFANIKGLPVWWNDGGISTVKYDANFGNFEQVSLTDNTIKDFIFSIPEENRRFVKAAYDIEEDIAFFLYSSFDFTSSEDYYIYDRVLCMNSINGAFYPWTIGDSFVFVRGLCYVTDGSSQETPAIKYTGTIDVNLGVTEWITYLDINNPTYKDWSLLAQIVDDETFEVDYTSYFVTGYKLDGQAARFFQSNYIWVFLEQEQDASCYVQGIWDFTTSGSSGKFSSKQEIYNSFLENRSINHRRLKIRGKGRSLQLRFNSSTGKPFTIIGWVVYESINAAI